MRIIDLKSVQGMIDNLLHLSVTRNLLYVTDLTGMRPSGKMEHLSCFLPALLALGAKLLDPGYQWPLDAHLQHQNGSYEMPTDARAKLKSTLDLHMLAAKGLATTCYALYTETPSGIGPNEVVFEGPIPDTAPRRRNYGLAKWKHRVDEWEANGRKGVLAGTDLMGWELHANETAYDAGERKVDYSIRNGVYLLRPEVNINLNSSVLLFNG